MLLLNS